MGLTCYRIGSTLLRTGAKPVAILVPKQPQPDCLS